jgi:hypothetical protein
MALKSTGSPRRIVVVVLAVVIVPSLLLIVLGWRLFQQDRDAALQQLEDRRRQTADLVVAQIEQGVSATELSIRAGQSSRDLTAHDAAAVVVVDKGGMSVVNGRVAFLPRPMPGREIPSSRFAAADDLNRRGDAERAAVAYRTLAQHPDAAIRAGALLRLVWHVAPRDRPRALLPLAGIQGVSVEGVPVDLLARVERCRLLDELGRTDELRRDATALRDNLLNGQWSIAGSSTKRI